MTGPISPPAAIKIGISSWGSLPGFYPSGIKAVDKLRWFSRFYNIVEVNVSFYRLVPPHTYDGWVDMTPSGFLFDVKAFSELTHFRDPPLDRTFKAFRETYRPLQDRQRLGGVLFQFPPRFVNSSVSRDYLGRVASAMDGEISIVEFRHHSWLATDRAERTFELLGGLGLAYAVADEPQFPGDTVPPLPAVTNPALAYVRLHGRNAAAWHRPGDSGDRYNYNYSSAELEEWAATVKELATQAATVHVLFNNNAKGDGTRNALNLASILGLAPADTPALPAQQPRLYESED